MGEKGENERSTSDSAVENHTTPPEISGVRMFGRFRCYLIDDVLSSGIAGDELQERWLVTEISDHMKGILITERVLTGTATPLTEVQVGVSRQTKEPVSQQHPTKH